MGIKNLNTLIMKYAYNGVKQKNLNVYKNKILLIDTNIYLYKYLYGNSNHINGFFFQINKLKKFGIIPIYIFEGKPPAEKNNTIKKRKRYKLNIKNRIEKIAENIKLLENKINCKENLQELINQRKNLEKKLVYINVDVIEKTKNLFDLMGIHYIEASCEAEHLCSYLIKNKYAHGVITEDMDTLPCGSDIVIKNFSNRSDYIQEYNLNDIITNLNLKFEEFIDMCILFGTDYNNRITGLNPNQIYKLIIKHKNLEKIYKPSVKLDNLIKIRKIFNLEYLKINKNNIDSIKKKKLPNLPSLKLFLKQNSTIDKKLYNHRIYLMFGKDKKINLYSNLYINSLKKRYKINKNGNIIKNNCITV